MMIRIEGKVWGKLYVVGPLYWYFRGTGPIRQIDFRIAETVSILFMPLSFVALTRSVPR